MVISRRRVPVANGGGEATNGEGNNGVHGRSGESTDDAGDKQLAPSSSSSSSSPSLSAAWRVLWLILLAYFVVVSGSENRKKGPNGE